MKGDGGERIFVEHSVHDSNFETAKQIVLLLFLAVTWFAILVTISTQLST